MTTARRCVPFGCLFAVMLLVLPASSAPDWDGRRLFIVGNEESAYQQNNRRGWVQYVEGRPWRELREVRRTQQFVELYTDNPQPTWVRLTNRRVYWKTVGDPDYRAGKPGYWINN